jgi:hypothetical protein
MGFRPQIVMAPRRELWGVNTRAELQPLIDYAEGRR